MFWKDQPISVEKKGSKESSETVTSTIKPIEYFQSEIPISLPTSSLYWDYLDPKKENTLDDIYNLLKNHYVEGNTKNFMLYYSKEYLSWVFNVPTKYICVGLRSKNDSSLPQQDRLVGVIVSFCSRTNIHGVVTDTSFLCVHKKFRNLNLAPLLISEITRLISNNNLSNVSLYMNNRPYHDNYFCVTTCYHRMLNPEKLVKSKFYTLPVGMNLDKLNKKYKIETELPKGMRETRMEDIESIVSLLNGCKAKLFKKWGVEEARYILMPRKGVFYSYVMEKNGVVVDFISFYKLQLNLYGGGDEGDEGDGEGVVGGGNGEGGVGNGGKGENPKDKIDVAYHYTHTNNNLRPMLKGILSVAKNNGFDMYNMVNGYVGEDTLNELKFIEGDGKMYSFLYNCNSSMINPIDYNYSMF